MIKICLMIALVINSIYAQCDDEEYSTSGVLDNINEQIYRQSSK